MISAVDKININVRDQDAARRCWIETMGFSLITDEPIGEEPGGARWIEVRPPHSAVTLVLYSLTFDASRLGVGEFTALVMVAGIGGITRFGSARKLASWAGLTPTVRGSDLKVRHGNIPGRARRGCGGS